MLATLNRNGRAKASPNTTTLYPAQIRAGKPTAMSATTDFGRMVYLDLDLLFGDPRYQRVEDLTSKKIKEISENWCWMACHALVVSERENGRYAIIDGLGHATAFKLANPSGLDNKGKRIKLPCRIVPVSNVQEEARLYELMNASTRPTKPHEQFKARHTAGHPIECAIVSILTKAGINITYSKGRLPANTTKATGNLRNAFMLIGERKFQLLINILTTYQRPEYKGVIEEAALHACFIYSLAVFLTETDLSDAQVLRNLENGYSAAEINQWANNHATGHGGHTRFNDMANAFRQSALTGSASS